MTHLVVVGADGSATATAAIEWAADDAARMKAPLRIVFAVDRSPYEISKLSDSELTDALNRGAQKVLADAEEIARTRQPGIDVTAEMIQGAPAVVLRAQAEDAAEIVIGSRGMGGFAAAIVGSVCEHVAGHAHGPVVIVRPGQEDVHGEVVVGIDDYLACEPAIAYAFEQATLRDCPLRAIYAWQPPVHVYAPELAFDMDDLRAARQHVATDKLRAWREKYPQVTVIEDVQCAHPVEALTTASDKAALVIVGSQGRGSIGSVMLGSVSRGVLHQARSAVAIVRP